MTTRACFVLQEPARYIEVLRTAALLVAAARELEKAGDSVCCTPHVTDGERRSKTRLLDKPQVDQGR